MRQIFNLFAPLMMFISPDWDNSKFIPNFSQLSGSCNNSRNNAYFYNKITLNRKRNKIASQSRAKNR